jgi:hypothetical protein
LKYTFCFETRVIVCRYFLAKATEGEKSISISFNHQDYTWCYKNKPRRKRNMYMEVRRRGRHTKQQAEHNRCGAALWQAQRGEVVTCGNKEIRPLLCDARRTQGGSMSFRWSRGEGQLLSCQVWAAEKASTMSSTDLHGLMMGSLNLVIMGSNLE